MRPRMNACFRPQSGSHSSQLRFCWLINHQTLIINDNTDSPSTFWCHNINLLAILHAYTIRIL